MAATPEVNPARTRARLFRRALELRAQGRLYDLADAGLDDVFRGSVDRFVEIAWRLDPRTGRLLVMSAEDNILKGAAGQAVQSLNILCGFPETAGLV
jgi:hypothetical protein